MKKWPFLVAIAMVGTTLSLLQGLSRAEPSLDRERFSSFPMKIAERWTGQELGMEPEIVDFLQVTDFMMRRYVPTDQQGVHSPIASAPVYLYVGYYASQQTGATYHSPKNCLPASGWQVKSSEPWSISIDGGERPNQVLVNKVVIEKGLDKQVIFYWYQDRGRVIASEYSAKAYLIWDAMRHNRTDGALVRISVPVTSDVDSAFLQAESFVQDVWPQLGSYFPPQPTTGTN